MAAIPQARHRIGRGTSPGGVPAQPVRWAALVACLLAPALALPASAARIDVPAQQPTVRAGVEAAANGDTVLVAPGVHPGGVFITGKRVTLASWFILTGDTALIAQTVIDSVVGSPCGGATSCAGNAVLEFGSGSNGSAVIGLTIQRGVDGIRSRAVVDVAHCRVIRNADGIDYQNDSGGIIRNSLFAWNSDDGIDLNGRLTMRIVDNIIRDNHQDGVEFRLYAYTGPVHTIEFIGNLFSGNGGDGIQLIDYPDASSRVIRIERNVFTRSGDAAVGCMPDGRTSEDFSGAPIAERVYLIHNTFTNERYGFVGGANVIALNNVFVNVQVSALRRVGGNSITSYSLFWNNGIHYEDSNLDMPNILHADPMLGPDARPSAGSPVIDAGTAFFQWMGETVLNLPGSAYLGAAPDMGAFEFGGAPPGDNAAPVVDAGPDQNIVLPADALLDGTVSDDGLPIPPGALTTTWSVAGGPGPVVFADANAVDTRATFSAAGTYALRLTASDGALSTSDQVQITVEAAPPGSGTVQRRIAAGSDDAEESATGSVSVSSGDLELVYDKSNQTVGLRFTNVTVPRGATLLTAHVQFQADETQNVATNLVLQGQAADHAATFTSGTGNISSRPRTAAAMAWSPPPWALVGEAAAPQRTPELRSVLQEIVNRPGWSSGNALAILITGTGHRTAESYEGLAAAAPLLHIEYASGPPPPNTAPVVNAGPDQTITLPAGAALSGTVSDDGQPPPGAVTTTWSAVSGPGPVTVLDASALSTQASFTTAGVYLLRLTASDGELDASDDVQVTVQPAPPPGAASLERRVSAGTDDAEERADGRTSTNSTDLELIYDRSDQTVGLRFTNVTIPRGATITAAYVQFAADERQNVATNLTVQAQAADNAAPFASTSGNVSTRPRTGAAASWAPPPWDIIGEAGPAQRTSDLAAVIQEVVNRTGWASGNALVLIITGTGHRTAESFEGKAVAAPLLRIEYDTGGSAADAVAGAPTDAGGGAGDGEQPAESDAEDDTEDELEVADRATDPVSRLDLAVHGLTPNPARGALTVEFTLAGEEAAVLELMDVTGRRIASRGLSSLGPGRHRLALDHALPAGVYLVRLTQGARSVIAKATVLP